MAPRSAFALITLLAAASLQAADAQGRKSRSKSDDAKNKVLLARHSLTSPMAFMELLDDWYLSGSALIEKERVLMHSATAERQGVLLSKQPLLTNNFEVLVKFRVTGPPAGTPSHEQSFGIFLTDENVSASFPEMDLIKSGDWPAAMLKAGYKLAGFQSTFKGHGVVLSQLDSESKLNPVVTHVEGDAGSRTPTKGRGVSPRDVPKASSVKLDFRNTLNPAQLKIRVHPTFIEGHIKQTPSLSWVECFKVEKPQNQGAYLGISAWSGAKGSVPDSVSILSVEVFNHDSTQAGEDLKDMSAEQQQVVKDMINEEHSHYADQEHQTRQLDTLTQLLDKHMNDSRPADLKLFTDLEQMQNRMITLGENCAELTQEVKLVMAEKHPQSHVDHLKHEIKGLRSIFSAHAEEHKNKVEQVQAKTREMKSSPAHNPKAIVDLTVKMTATGLEVAAITDVAATQRNTHSGLFGFMFIVVLVLGYLMHQRMTYYEKKHFM